MAPLLDIYQHRVKMRQTQLAQQYFEINQLENYLNELQDNADN